MSASLTLKRSPLQNDLLSALPPDVQNQLFPHLQSIPLGLGAKLYDSGERSKYVYFPISVVVSLLYMTEDGASTETAIVGREGIVGVAAFLGGESLPSCAVVHTAGQAYRVNASLLMAGINHHGPLLWLLLRYVQALMAQTAQIVVCNRYHTIEQQLCRRLLQTLDRLSGNQITMTQELIANLLGVRREGITEAAGRLQKLGAIHYHRGHITVLDRRMLERLSCECYRSVKEEVSRLFPKKIMQITANHKFRASR